MGLIAVLLVWFFCSPVCASGQNTSNVLAFSEEWAVFLNSDFDLEACYEEYFGRSFIHNEDIEVEKYGVDSPVAGSSESVVFASGICVGGDALLVENNANVKTRAWYPGAEGVGSVDSVSKSFGMSLINGGVALNHGTIDAGASGEAVLLSTDGKYDDVGARLASLSCGMWATRSGQLAFSQAAEPADPDATDCLALNLGEISVSADLGEYSAGVDATYHAVSMAYGIYCDDDGLGVNAGKITAMASGGIRLKTNASSIQADIVSCGIFAADGSVAINTGSIAAKAYGDALEDATAGDTSAVATVRAQAMGIFGDKGATVINTGVISVAADGGAAGEKPLAGAYGLVASSGGRILNTGTISVSARSRGTASAYGIVSTGDAELYSAGVIDVAAVSEAGDASAYAFAVYAEEGRLAVKEYGMHLADDPHVLEGIWAHSATGSFDLTDATLYVRIDEDTPFNMPYRIDGAVSGEINKFSRVDGAFPEDIELVSLNDNESILLQYSPKFDPAMKALQQTTRVVNQCVAMADQALMNAAWERSLAFAATGEAPGEAHGNRSEGVKIDGDNTLFLTPYATRVDDDDYNARDHGFCGGGYHAWGQDTFAGVHFALGRGQLDFDSARQQDRETRMTHSAIGVQGLHRFTPNASLRFSSTFFRSGHAFEDKDPQNLEEARYSNHGIITRLAGSFAYRPTSHTVLAPEIALRHEWLHQDAFTTEHMSWMGTSYGALEENELYAEAALDWRGRLKKGGTEIHPRIRLFAEQVLTDGRMAGTMALADHQETLEKRENDPRFGAQISASITDGITSLAFGYTGRIEEEITQQSGWVNVQVYF